MLTREDILNFTADAGFNRTRILSGQTIRKALERIDAVEKSGFTDNEETEELKEAWYKFNRQFDPGKNGSFIISALSSYRRERCDLSEGGNPHGLIAPFARRNYYGEAVSRMKEVFRRIREKTGLKKSDGRIFCNSRLFEKPLAEISGLGFYGKNTLIISPGLGSNFVIAGLYVPIKLEKDDVPQKWAALGEMCGNCTACIDACPVNALVRPGVLNEKKCLQYKASRYMHFSEDEKRAWGAKLYGCQICQDICPYNKKLEVETATERGDIGPSISLKTILTMEPEEIKRIFRDTQMGLSWVSARAIIRNAIIASGNKKDKSMLPYLKNYINSTDAVLKESAEWAAEKIEE